MPLCSSLESISLHSRSCSKWGMEYQNTNLLQSEMKGFKTSVGFDEMRQGLVEMGPLNAHE